MAVIITSQVLPEKSKDKTSIELPKAPPPPPLPPIPPTPPPIPDEVEIGDWLSPETELSIPTPDDTNIPNEKVYPPKAPVPPAPPEYVNDCQ
jgi:hypothetical protein